MSAIQTIRERPRIFRVQDWRLATKLLAAFMLMVIAPIAVFASVGVPRVRDSMLLQGSTSLLHDGESTSDRLDQYLMNKREDIVVASGARELFAFLELPLLPNTKASALQSLKTFSARADYESVALMSLDGKILLSSSENDIGTDDSFRPYFLEAKKGNVYISDPSVSIVTNRPAIFFSAPVRNTAAEIVGVVRSRLRLDGIWALVEKDKDSSGPGTYGLLLDENGIRLATSLSLGDREAVVGSMLYSAVMPVPAQVEQMMVAEKRYGNATASSVRVVHLPDIANALTTPGITSFETSVDHSNERHFAAISAMSSKPWHYVLMTPLSTFTGAADNLRLFQFAILVIIGAIAAMAAIFIARGITNPINQLTKVADRISLGELDAKIDVNRKDEVGELAEAVSRMQASLQAAIERLRARRSAG